MPPKKKKRSKSMPKQRQSQRQSVVVNIGTSKTKSKPRKSRGRGGLPPPSYQHNLAPTFVTQQATDYNPVIGAIQGLTAKLNEQPRIQQPVTPLSSTVQATPSQSAEQMAGEAALRRAGPTADSFVSHASQVRNAPSVPMGTVDYVMPREVIGTNRPTRVVTGELIRQADEYFTERLLKPTDNFQRLPSHKRASEKSDSSSDSSLIVSSDSEGPAAGGGGPPRVFKTPPKVLAKARQEAQERKGRLDSIREKIKEKQQITTEERQFVMKTTGTKRLQRTLYMADVSRKYQSSDDQPSTRQKSKGGKKIVVENI